MDRNEYNRICQCKSAKEIWRLLEITHEGTNQVKESKINLLVHNYELFSMKETETIVEMITRFTDIVNGLEALGKTYKESEKVMKILRSLPSKWHTKVTAIQEAKDLTSISFLSIGRPAANHSKRWSTPLTPFRKWRALEEAIPTLHCLASRGQEPPLLRIRHFRPQRPHPFHLLRVECPLTLLNANTRREEHRLLHPLIHLYVTLQLRGSGLQALQSHLSICSLILKPQPILNILLASHRKPSSRGLWSPYLPLRAIQIVEPDHSIPSFILTLRPCHSSQSFKIHLDCPRGTISSTLWLPGSSFTP